MRLWLSLLACAFAVLPARAATISLRAAGGDQPRLIGLDSHLQLIATIEDSGKQTDATRTARYTIQPSDIASIDNTGSVTPLHNGSAKITASFGSSSSTINLQIVHCESPVPIHFVNQIVPIFTKAGCNTGGCHGKSSGQNGFRLSLMGFEPTEDYEHLVYESRGRRLSPAAPEHSLLLLKATGMLPHGGGKRLETTSDDYKLLVRWISQGMPIGDPKAPSVVGIDVFPATRTIPLGGEQQLLVTAHYTDGSVQDVTRNAVFESGDKQMASVDALGHVIAMKEPGSVSVMVRYQGKVAAFQAMLPLGAPVDHLPPTKNFIDELVFSRLKAMGMPPSGLCDDATFIRRVTLDIAGRLPTVDETKSFLADPSAGKRDVLIDRLLDSGDYADYFANKWSALLRNKRSAPNEQRGNYLFHAWIRRSIYENKPYDQFVREIITASGEVSTNPPVEWYTQVGTTKAALEDTAQLFLGTRIQCAQCHHHPYEKWSQKDYYQLSAFFTQVQREPTATGDFVVYTRRAPAVATNIRNGRAVQPAGLGAKPISIDVDDDARTALVDWMVAPQNPLFAPALVNRYWKHFFNRGLVEPEDDLRETNPATNPELLRALAQHFIASKYDLKDLVRTICRSNTYQLTAMPNRYNESDKQNYARFYPKRLTAEVLLDSVDTVTGSVGNFEDVPAGTRAVQLPDNSFNASSYFLTIFGRPEASSACECERSNAASLAQSLHLLNSQDILAKIDAPSGRAIRLADDPSQDGDAKVQQLYLLALSRAPTNDELSAARQYISRTRRDKSGTAHPMPTREAFEDITWALLNTKEFLFNH